MFVKQRTPELAVAVPFAAMVPFFTPQVLDIPINSFRGTGPMLTLLVYAAYGWRNDPVPIPAPAPSEPHRSRARARLTVERGFVSSDAMVQRPPAGTIPDAPGSYQFKDRDGRVIYVGKARSLRSRLSNYFQNPRNLPPRTAQMVATAETVEWIQVRNDVEALMLEYSLIKQHRPRFNVRLRDDKSYPFLAVTVEDEWPRPMVMRGRKRKGVRYFGPYGHAYAIRETLDLLLRTFPLRTCSDNKFGRHERLGRPVPAVPHREVLRPLRRGDRQGDLRPPHRRAARVPRRRHPEVWCSGSSSRCRRRRPSSEYERAARLRDRLANVQKAIEKQQMVAERNEDFDVLGMAEDDLEAAFQAFFVRKGRVVGRKGFIVDKVEDLTPGELVEKVLEGLYDDPPLGIPKQVLVPVELSDCDLYEEWLSSIRGSNVQIRVPQRGGKRELQTTVTRNAKEEFTRHRLKRASDHNSRARALNELQDRLGLPEPPLRIECYDMSHIQGSDYVGSMVVLEDGLAKKSDYRRFKIKEVPGNDDFAAMEEVLTRRLTAYLAERDRPVTDRPNKFAYPPQLLLVDGGKGQLSVAIAGARGARPRRGDPGGVAGEAVRGGLRPRAWPTPSASRAAPRRSTCCSASATRPTGSRSRTTASCGASA